MCYIDKNKIISVASVMWAIVTLAFISFIFSRSLTPAVVSSQESGTVVNYVNTLLSSINLNSGVTDFIVRKSAHFMEFFILGVLLTKTVASFVKEIWQRLFPTLFFALLIPVMDEALQYFSAGRSSEVKDVLLDFLGALTAIALVNIIYFVSKRCKKRKKEKR